MKKYFSFLLITCILVSFSSGCTINEPKLTDERLEEYSMFDYNVIWEKGDSVLRDSLVHDYYSIAGIPQEEFIALRYKVVCLYEYWYLPVVLMHQDKGGEYSLDASTAQLTLRTSYVTDKENDEFWMDVGEKSRVQVICDIDEKIAKEVADSLIAKNRQYLTGEQLEMYEHVTNELYCEGPDEHTRFDLHIEFRLTGYENLVWTGHICKADQDYLIEIHTAILSKFPSKLVRCSDELSAFIKQVDEEYGFSS